MSFSKQIKQIQYPVELTFEEKLNCKYVKQNLAREFIDNISFARNHPLYPDWKEWKEVVANFYSFNTGQFQRTLFACTDVDFLPSYDWCEGNSAMFHAVSFSQAAKFWKPYKPQQYHTILAEILYSGRQFYPGHFNVPGPYPAECCDCIKRYFEEWDNTYPYEECRYQREHILQIYISLIVHIAKKQPRSLRKYYRRLAKVIYVLPLRFLIDIDINKAGGLVDLILNPRKYFIPGRNLLRQIYERGFLDKLYCKDFSNFPFWFENTKHFRTNPVEQGSTGQSVSATLFDEIVALVSTFPKQQGWSVGNLYLKHELKISEEQFSKFEETVERTHHNFMESLKNTLLESAKEILVLFVFVATVAMLGYTVIKYGLDTIISTLNLLYKVTVGKLFTGDDSFSVVEQNGGISLPFLPALVVNNIIEPPAKILSTLWNSPQTDRVMRRIGFLGDPKVGRGIDKITDWLQNLIRETINWYKEVVLGLAPTEDIDTECSPVARWYNDCDEYFKKYYEGTLQWNDINWSILMNLYGRGMALVRQNVYAEFKQDIWKIVFKLGNLLEKFNQHGRNGATIRNPPVTIYLAGGTGVGKSSVTYPLAAEILQGIFARESSGIDLVKYWKNLIYMRCPEQEFWDGYENQLVTIFDDFGQLVDSTSSPNLELFEVIRAANSFPYPLHMASLDQKATTTFNSKIIMASSNLDQPKTASLNFTQALYRRFDVCVKVTNKPGCVKIPGKFDPTIYEFQLYDMSTQMLGEFVSYKDLIYLAVTKYFERKGFVDTMDDYITSMLKKEERPTQQGYGTALGNTCCALKEGTKYVLNNVVSNYRDFMGTLNGDIYHSAMLEIRTVLEEFRYRLFRIHTAWANFKKEHKYIYKALKFVGVITLIFGVVKLYNNMTRSSKKEKLMSVDQFIRSEHYTPAQVRNARVEGYNSAQVKNAKVEGYNIVTPRNPRVEVFVSCECKLGSINKPHVFIDNSSCSECKDKGLRHGSIVEQGAVVNPKSEKWYPILGHIFCEHELAERYNELGPLQMFWLVKSSTCEKCYPKNPVQEGVRDINAAEIMAKVIRSNYYKLYTVDSNEPIGHALFLRGQIMMCPRHYISVFRRIAGAGGSNRIYMQNVFIDRAFEIDVAEILDNAYFHESPEEKEQPILSRDIMAFPVKTATFHANIIPYFADNSSLAYVKSSDVVLPILCNNNIKDSERPCVYFRYSKGHSSLCVKEQQVIDNEQGIPVRIMRNLWEYSMDTQASECGAPLIVRNVQISPGKIIGMHVAGHDSGLGYSTPIYRKDVEDIVSKFNPYDSVEFRLKRQYGEYPTQQCQVPDAHFIKIGSIERPVAQPSKSKIVPSPLFNKIKDVETKPCLLRSTQIDGQEFHPRTYRLSKLGNIPTFIRSLEVELAEEALVDEISECIKNVDFGNNIKNVYTFEEAVVGIDGEEYINSIKRGTSPGYPYIHMKGFENRKLIFGDDEKCDLSRPACVILQKRVNDIIYNCKKGVISEHIFMDTLKDERKPIHKAHKTRLFSAGPIDYLIACKQYFNGIVAVLQKARNVSGIAVGTKKNSFDWSNVARKVLSKSNNIVAGDFEGFDASQSQRLLMSAGKVLISLSKRFCGTTDEDAFVMWCLLISLFNSVHVSGQEIYQWTHSLPSGHYLTAIINSIFVLLSFCVIWQLYQREQNCKKPSYILARSFYKQCGLIAYGDDHILSVPSHYKEFNQKSIPNYFKKIGLTYTMEDKDATVEHEFRNIKEISFLKRRFVYDKEYGMWMDPLDLRTILESPMWLHKCPDPVEQCISQVDDSLRELSIHDIEQWQKWYPVFAECMEKLGHYTEFKKHADTRAVVLDQDLNM